MGRTVGGVGGARSSVRSVVSGSHPAVREENQAYRVSVIENWPRLIWA